MSDLYNVDAFASDAFKGATNPEANAGKSKKYLNVMDYKRLTAETGIEKFKFEPDGEYTFSFLPFPITEGHPNYRNLKSQNIGRDWRLNLFLHTVVTANGNQRFVCPQKTFGKPCPFCEAKTEIFNRPGGWEQHKDELKKYNDTLRNYFIVMNHADGKLYVMEYSHYYFGEKLEKKLARTNGTDRQIILADPRENRHALHFWVDASALKDSKGKPIIGPISEMEFVSRSEAIPLELLQKVPALDKYIVQYTYEDMEGFVDGTYFVDGDDDDSGIDPDIAREFPNTELPAQPNVEPVQRVREEPTTSAPTQEASAMSEREKRRLARMQQASNSQTIPTCPVPGGKFGQDTDKYDECEECPLYENCANEFDKNNSDIPF